MNKTVNVVVRNGNSDQASAIFSLMRLLHKLGIVWVQQVMDARTTEFKLGHYK